MPPQEEPPVLTTGRDQVIPFFGKSIEIGLAGEHRCCNRGWFLDRFSGLVIERGRPIDSLLHYASLAKSNECGLFLQGSSRLFYAWYPVHTGRRSKYIMGDRGHGPTFKLIEEAEKSWGRFSLADKKGLSQARRRQRPKGLPYFLSHIFRKRAFIEAHNVSDGLK